MRASTLFASSFALALIAAGCGGGGSSRQIGTTDQRIVGQWRGKSITLDGQSANCPGEVTSGNAEMSCSDSTSTVHSDGRVVTDGETINYYFNGSTLTLYTNPRLSEQVTFSEDNNTMTWTHTLDGHTYTAVLERVVVQS